MANKTFSKSCNLLARMNFSNGNGAINPNSSNVVRFARWIISSRNRKRRNVRPLTVHPAQASNRSNQYLRKFWPICILNFLIIIPSPYLIIMTRNFQPPIGHVGRRMTHMKLPRNHPPLVIGPRYIQIFSRIHTGMNCERWVCPTAHRDPLELIRLNMSCCCPPHSWDYRHCRGRVEHLVPDNAI